MLYSGQIILICHNCFIDWSSDQILVHWKGSWCPHYCRVAIYSQQLQHFLSFLAFLVEWDVSDLKRKRLCLKWMGCFHLLRSFYSRLLNKVSAEEQYFISNYTLSCGWYHRCGGATLPPFLSPITASSLFTPFPATLSP